MSLLWSSFIIHSFILYLNKFFNSPLNFKNKLVIKQVKKNNKLFENKNNLLI
jgi:hypothetical protein